MEELAAERRAVTARSHELRVEKRRLQEKARAARRHRASGAGRGAAAALVAELAPEDERAEAVAEFWRQAAPGGSEPCAAVASAVAELPSEIGDAPSSEPPPEGPPAEVPMPPAAWPAAVARRFLQERQLRQWVRSMNAAAGLAPSTAHVWAVYRGIQSGSDDPGGSLRGAAGGASRRALQWVRRWRRRWQLHRRAPAPGAGLRVETLRAKALLASRKGGRGATENGTAEPRWGPKTRPRFRPRFPMPVMLEGPISGPKSGPHFGSRNRLGGAILGRLWRRFGGTDFWPPPTRRASCRCASTWTRAL